MDHPPAVTAARIEADHHSALPLLPSGVGPGLARLVVIVSIGTPLFLLISMVLLAQYIVTEIHRPPTAPPPAPVLYPTSEVQAERTSYCPGETLVYTQTVFVAQPVHGTVRRLDPLRSWRSLTTGGAARLRNGDLAPVDDPPPRNVAAGTRTGQVRVVVPDLPPGLYALDTTVAGTGTGEDSYSLTIDVVPCRTSRP